MLTKIQNDLAKSITIKEHARTVNADLCLEMSPSRFAQRCQNKFNVVHKTLHFKPSRMQLQFSRRNLERLKKKKKN